MRKCHLDKDLKVWGSEPSGYLREQHSWKWEQPAQKFWDRKRAGLMTSMQTWERTQARSSDQGGCEGCGEAEGGLYSTVTWLHPCLQSITLSSPLGIDCRGHVDGSTGGGKKGFSAEVVGLQLYLLSVCSVSLYPHLPCCPQFPQHLGDRYS